MLIKVWKALSYIILHASIPETPGTLPTAVTIFFRARRWMMPNTRGHCLTQRHILLVSRQRWSWWCQADVEQPETTAVLFTRLSGSITLLQWLISSYTCVVIFFKDQLFSSIQSWVFFLCCKISIFLETPASTPSSNSALVFQTPFHLSIHSLEKWVLSAYYLPHFLFSDHHVNICIPPMSTRLLACFPLTLSFYNLYAWKHIFKSTKYDFHSFKKNN